MRRGEDPDREHRRLEPIGGPSLRDALTLHLDRMNRKGARPRSIEVLHDETHKHLPRWMDRPLASIERKEREVAFEKWKREDAERRRLQNIKDSRDELFAVIDAWGAVRRIEGFFEDVERRAATLTEREADEVRARVLRARALIGDANAFGRLLAWKAPGER